MYERNAIVLERYLSKIFGQDKVTSITSSYNTYTDILEEMEKYQIVTEEEEKVIEEFDAIAQKMQTIQKRQEKICLDSIQHEQERNKLFNDFEQEPISIEKRLLKSEKIIEDNEEEQKQLREEYVQLLNEFTEKQKERNKCSKTRRIVETNHMKSLNETIDKIEAINPENIRKVKEFITLDDQAICQSLNKVMLENGKNERVKFNTNVIKKAVETRIEIAKKEAECYVNCYEKLKKFMSEIEGESIKLAKYQKIQKDTTIKLNFLAAEKEYIISFLDNERMTAINGEKMHKQMMQEACQNYDLDIQQINNLYGLILREITGKATKKAYREMYNSTYLTDIEQTEKNFNQEVNNIHASVGTIINTNYWRIEGIKNLYEIFNEEVTEKYGRDLTEFMPEEERIQDINEMYINETPNILGEELDEDIEDNSYEEEEEEWFITNEEVEPEEEFEKESLEENENEFEEDEEEQDNLDEDYQAEEDEEDDFELGFEDDEDDYDEEDDEFDYEEDDEYEENENEEDEAEEDYDSLDDSKIQPRRRSDEAFNDKLQEIYERKRKKEGKKGKRHKEGKRLKEGKRSYKKEAKRMVLEDEDDDFEDEEDKGIFSKIFKERRKL